MLFSLTHNNLLPDLASKQYFLCWQISDANFPLATIHKPIRPFQPPEDFLKVILCKYKLTFPNPPKIPFWLTKQYKTQNEQQQHSTRLSHKQEYVEKVFVNPL